MPDLKLLKRQAFALGAFLQFLEDADEETLDMAQRFFNEAAGQRGGVASAAKSMRMAADEYAVAPTIRSH